MKLLTILFIMSTISLNTFAQLRLPSVISDNMILQREMNVPVWGWAKPKSTVNVKFMNQKKITTADAEGCWEIKLDPMEATDKQQKMLIESGGDIVTLTKILVGEVWVCSGQSNMEFPMGMIKDSEKEIAKANDKNIRFLAVDKFNFKPYECDNCDATWLDCLPEFARERSAAAYFFARELRKKLNVPIGLIEVHFGGSSIGAWTSENVYKKWPGAQEELSKLAKYNNNKKYNLLKKRDKLNWFNELKKIDKGFSNNWMDVKKSLKGWKKIQLPVAWNSTEKLKDFKGTVWFRKEIVIPKNWKNKKLVVELGVIDQYDIAWLNGKNFGMMQKPNLSWVPRSYKIESSDYKVGKNTIVLCDYNQTAGGGLLSPKESIRIFPENSPEKAVSIAGEWYYKKGYSGTELPKAPVPFSIGYHSLSVLYNSMITPITPFGIRGVLWYQGESNQLAPNLYKEMMEDMIKNWRDDWDQGNFPFYYVQIAPCNYNNGVNSALLREAQLFAMDITNTGMAVTMDIGNPNDIHPKNKKDVGKRLALWALAKNYGFKNLVFSGPVYKKMRIDGNKIVLVFNYADGLKTRDGKDPSHFEIAGDNKKFFPAIAEIKNKKIVVYSDKVKKPVAVRYGWSDIAEPNLCNKANLPASSFRTDDWK